jgi:DNA-binding response OmpR family regulator
MAMDYRRIHEQKAIDLPLRGARVLVVEDDPLLLLELESILQDAGAEIVACCRDVIDGLKAIQGDGLAAAVLDVRIGRATVAPVARELAERGTPFLFYTGQVENDPALAEWSDHIILSKPARPAVIVAAVALLLERARAKQRAH